MYYGRLGVFFCEGSQRVTGFRIAACGVIAVKLVDILDELAVEEMERNALGTYS